ncbi:MAG: hypothetical protein K8I60_11675 [Anaerolineae bacterium]|nr:hypothetical protein [Anaerolineae bacterium]
MENKIAALGELFRQTGHAHHQAYLATDGADEDWPIWYANYLYDKLPAHLGVTLTRSDIVYALMRLDKELKSEAPGADWSKYYARSLVTRYS